ncbi:hypothetical protein ACUHGC_04560 [Testudinibacter sp. P27/CKL/0425]
MQNIYIKASIAIFLSAFLAACSGGGSSSQSAPIASNLTVAPANSTSGSKVDSSAVTDLKEKEALQKAEADRKARLEKEKADKEKAEKESAENTIVDEPKATSDQPTAPQPLKETKTPVYGGYSISLDGSRSAWDGKTGNYEVKKEGNEFKPSITSGVSNLQIGDTKLELIAPNNIDLGYYGYVSTFTPDNGVVGEGSGQKRAVDLLYAYDTNRKDTAAPMLNGYQGTVTYGGDFWYIVDAGNTDNAAKADISLSYNPSGKTLVGHIRDTNKGVNLDLQLTGELNGDFMMTAKPAKTGHSSTQVTEPGVLNGQFLDQGKYIVGDAQSGDSAKQWQGVFGTKETERVAK